MGESQHFKKGYGFWADGRFFLQRCCDCGRENYSASVASGVCAWCGSTTHPPKPKEETKVPDER